MGMCGFRKDKAGGKREEKIGVCINEVIHKRYAH